MAFQLSKQVVLANAPLQVLTSALVLPPLGPAQSCDVWSKTLIAWARDAVQGNINICRSQRISAKRGPYVRPVARGILLTLCPPVSLPPSSFLCDLQLLF